MLHYLNSVYSIETNYFLEYPHIKSLQLPITNFAYSSNFKEIFIYIQVQYGLDPNRNNPLCIKVDKQKIHNCNDLM